MLKAMDADINPILSGIPGALAMGVPTESYLTTLRESYAHPTVSEVVTKIIDCTYQMKGLLLKKILPPKFTVLQL